MYHLIYNMVYISLNYLQLGSDLTRREMSPPNLEHESGSLPAVFPFQELPVALQYLILSMAAALLHSPWNSQTRAITTPTSEPLFTRECRRSASLPPMNNNHCHVTFCTFQFFGYARLPGANPKRIRKRLPKHPNPASGLRIWNEACTTPHENYRDSGRQ